MCTMPLQVHHHGRRPLPAAACSRLPSSSHTPPFCTTTCRGSHQQPSSWTVVAEGCKCHCSGPCQGCCQEPFQSGLIAGPGQASACQACADGPTCTSATHTAQVIPLCTVQHCFSICWISMPFCPYAEVKRPKAWCRCSAAPVAVTVKLLMQNLVAFLQLPCKQGMACTHYCFNEKHHPTF